MSDAEKVYGFDVNEYERPNQKWTCGRAADGIPCPLGPSSGGSCGAVCEPYKDGDRYYCGNASLLAGKCDQGPQVDGACSHFPAQCQPGKKEGSWECTRGKCDTGPLPDGRCSQHFAACRPVRGTLAKRKVLTLVCLALAIGTALIMVSGSTRTEMISPGPLTSQHRATEKGCAACHVVGDGHLNDWIGAALNASETGVVQSNLCLECHDELKPNALNPHGAAPSVLAAISERLGANEAASDIPLRLSAARTLFGHPDPYNNQFACATCHQEHHGRDFDLKHMSDQQCQSCHTAMFDGFHSGHPEFTDYPYTRRTRIYFDHQSHYGQHFEDFQRIMPFGQSPTSCVSCHELDTAGQQMIVRGFDVACAGCHAGQIEEDLSPGIVLAALPSLDVESLGTDVQIGQWPDNRNTPDAVSNSGRLPPLMDFLLSGDERYTNSRPIVETLQLWALAGADAEQLVAVQDYVWAIKSLWHDLANPDTRPLRQRLQQVLGPESSARQVTELLSTLASNEVSTAARKWLPQLDAEMVSLRNGQLPQTTTTAAPEPSTGRAQSSGYFRDSSNLSVRYRAAAHADRFLRHWLEASANSPRLPDSTARLFSALSQPTTTGRCTKCHTVDKLGDETVINWYGVHPSPARRDFTKFSHSPHLEMLGDQACQNCHQLKAGVATPAGYRAEFFGSDWSPRTDPHRFNSNFELLPKSNCTQCHNPAKVQDNCLSCHNYHVR